jgi:hypothetical protein
MRAIEDLLRKAYADAAQTVTPADIPAELPALAVRAQQAQRGPRRLAISLLAPIATAVVVLVAAVAISRLAPRPDTASGTHGATSSVTSSTGQQAPPPFFAALSQTGKSIQILSASTGKLLARLAPPAKGQFFSGVAATGTHGRTLLVALEWGGCKTRFFKSVLSAAGKPGALQTAGIPVIDGILPDTAFTATPDGSAVAFADYFCDGSGSLEVDSPRTGKLVSWATQAGDQVDSISLSTDGRAVSISGYEYAGLAPGAKPGTSSTRLSPVTAVLRTSPQEPVLDGQGVMVRQYSVAKLSPDAKTLYVCAKDGDQDRLDAYNVATKKLQRMVSSWASSTGNCSFTLDPAGQYALIANVAGHVSRLNLESGKLTPLPATGLSSLLLAW